MAWWNPWKRPEPEAAAAPQNAVYSVADPNLLEALGITMPTYANVPVTEQTVTGISAFYRAVSIVAGTIAGLPMPTLEDQPDGTTLKVRSVFDFPGGRDMDSLTPFEWKEIVVACLMMHGNAFAFPIRNGAGGLAQFQILHPSLVHVEWDPSAEWRRVYTVHRKDGSLLRLGPEDILHIMNFSFDGLRGASVLEIARNSLGNALAGDRASAKVFDTGAMNNGALVPEDDDLTKEEAEFARREIANKVLGWENAGTLAVLTRKFKHVAWQMSHKDAQFLESRMFSIEEVARWTGVPPHLLMQTEKQSSWGTGVAEQNRGLSRFTLQNWTIRMQERFGMWIPRTRRVQFDFAGMDRPVPEVETKLVLDMIAGRLITRNEGRKRLGWDPIPGGDELDPEPAPPPQLDDEPQREPEPAA